MAQPSTGRRWPVLFQLWSDGNPDYIPGSLARLYTLEPVGDPTPVCTWLLCISSSSHIRGWGGGLCSGGDEMVGSP